MDQTVERNDRNSLGGLAKRGALARVAREDGRVAYDSWLEDGSRYISKQAQWRNKGKSAHMREADTWKNGHRRRRPML